MSERTKRKLENKVNKIRSSEEGNDKKIGLFIFGHKFDVWLLIIVLIILAVGLIMMMSASAPFSYRTENGDSYYYFIRQIIFAGIGIVMMFIVSHLDYRILNSRIAWLAYVFGLRIYGTGTCTWNRC